MCFALLGMYQNPSFWTVLLLIPILAYAVGTWLYWSRDRKVLEVKGNAVILYTLFSRKEFYKSSIKSLAVTQNALSRAFDLSILKIVTNDDKVVRCYTHPFNQKELERLLVLI